MKDNWNAMMWKILRNPFISSLQLKSICSPIKGKHHHSSSSSDPRNPILTLYIRRVDGKKADDRSWQRQLFSDVLFFLPFRYECTRFANICLRRHARCLNIKTSIQANKVDGKGAWSSKRQIYDMALCILRDSLGFACRGRIVLDKRVDWRERERERENPLSLHPKGSHPLLNPIRGEGVTSPPSFWAFLLPLGRSSRESWELKEEREDMGVESEVARKGWSW